MDTDLKQIIWNQFGASIDMLENAIKDCPDKVWGDKPGFHEYWYIAYHTLFFLDYYMSETERDFAPPQPFTLDELDPAGVLPDRVYSKNELLKYLEYGREKSRKAFKAMTDEKSKQPCGFERKDFSVVELYMSNMRHNQHHAAQLNLLLRQKIDSAPRWVSKTKIRMSD